MNAGELLAKVTARAVPLEHSISGFGRFSQEDILHSLGLIPHSGAVMLLRVKYCGQLEFLQDLDIHFWTTIGDLALHEHWPYPIKFKGQSFYRNMGRIALAELIEPHVCLECGGTSIEIVNSKLQPCTPCRGTGRSKHSDRSRARLIGMPAQTWSQGGWGERYRQVQGVADTWEGMGLGGMVKRLKTA